MKKLILFLCVFGMAMPFLDTGANAQDDDKKEPRTEQRRRPTRGPGGRGGRRGRDDSSGLKVGQEAPAFKLKSLDGKSETELAGFKGKKPVVLLFGSYT